VKKIHNDTCKQRFEEIMDGLLEVVDENFHPPL
jgi:hypothetical protein